MFQCLSLPSSCWPLLYLNAVAIFPQSCRGGTSKVILDSALSLAPSPNLKGSTLPFSSSFLCSPHASDLVKTSLFFFYFEIHLQLSLGCPSSCEQSNLTCRSEPVTSTLAHSQTLTSALLVLGECKLLSVVRPIFISCPFLATVFSTAVADELGSPIPPLFCPPAVLLSEVRHSPLCALRASCIPAFLSLGTIGILC